MEEVHLNVEVFLKQILPTTEREVVLLPLSDTLFTLEHIFNHILLSVDHVPADSFTDFLTQTELSVL